MVSFRQVFINNQHYVCWYVVHGELALVYKVRNFTFALVKLPMNIHHYTHNEFDKTLVS